MRCLVTAGPTYERLDDVRRLTNFSTGRLGVELAGFLTAKGHRVSLLVGEQATWPGERRAADLQVFTTTQDLRERLTRLGGSTIDAVFHAAAVSDFTFGRVFERTNTGELRFLNEGKISTRQGNLLAELVPTPKLIGQLRDLYPRAVLVGWKFEVDGNRDAALARARQQMTDCRTDACVANGRAYGDGFGLLTGPNGAQLQHLTNREELYEALERLTL